MLALFLFMAAFVLSTGMLGVLVANSLLLTMGAGLLMAPLAGMYVRRCSPQQ